MRNTSYQGRIRTDIGLLKNLLDFKISGEDYINNQESIKTIGKVVDLIKDKKRGHVLFSIVQGTTRNIILVIKNKTFTNTTDYYDGYYISSWVKKEQISESFEVKIHDTDFKRNLYKELDSYSYLTLSNAIKYCVVDSFDGPTINTNRLNRLDSLLKLRLEPITNQVDVNNLSDEYTDLKDMSDKILKSYRDQLTSSENIVRNYVDKLNNPNLELEAYAGFDNSITICRIEKVINWIDNERTFSVIALSNSNGHLSTGKFAATICVTSWRPRPSILGNNIHLVSDSIYAHYDTTTYELSRVNLLGIPINLIDEGRYLVIINKNTSTIQDLIVGPDPKTHENYRELLEQCIDKRMRTLADDALTFDTSRIRDDELTMVLASYHEPNNNSKTQAILKAFKKMNDEYQFLAKKKKAEGKDIQITDNIRYNHEKGKVEYNDFSIEFNDEMTKSSLYQTFQKLLKEYYRGAVTEEQILNNILSLIFQSLERRLFARTKTEFTRDLIINDSIKLEIQHKISNSGARLLYLNGTKFNGNEILKIIREITCYRNPDEAKRFIENVGKIGLSVYIGITSGYEIKMRDKDKNTATRIFKFKKLKGRSNYELLLDTTSIHLKSKKLISILYKKFIGDYVASIEDKIEKIIFDNADSTIDYMKYKFLIDSSYEKYKENARKFLEKKVSDTDSEFVKYYDKKNRKILDAIKVVGLSGNTYLVAYNTTDSFVFLEPELNENKEFYTNGRYICMIDESNIKSNIGYDTVVSKLLSLKNDSSVAHTIYNLEEELNG